MQTSIVRSTVLRRHIALPNEHGAWVFLLSPLLIGLMAGILRPGAQGSPLATALLVIAALSAFLLRQPVSIAVKAYRGRRSREDLPAALFWIVAYSLPGLAAVAGLAALGFGQLLLLAVPAVPVFAWHMVLVSRRAERRQLGVEVVASGVLALAAPAAYWVASGTTHLLGDPLGWWLWLLAWLQSASSIVYAYLRLEQRVLKHRPTLPERLSLARRALLYTSFNLIFVGLLSGLGRLPPLLGVPYAVQWIETVWGTLRPACGMRPTAIGLRQLAVSGLFTIAFIVAWTWP